MNHMHLVVISEAVSNVEPRPCRIGELCIQSGLKPGDASEDLGGHSFVHPKKTFEVSQTQGTMSPDFGNTHRPVLSEQIFRNAAYFAVRYRGRESPQQELFNNGDPLCET